MASSQESFSLVTETHESDSFLVSNKNSVDENEGNIIPYMVEAKFKAAEIPVEEVDENEEASSRLANTDW